MFNRFQELEIKVHCQLCGEEAVDAHGSEYIHEKIVSTAVKGIDQLSHILKHVIRGLDDASLTQHYLIIQQHKEPFHVGA